MDIISELKQEQKNIVKELLAECCSKLRLVASCLATHEEKTAAKKYNSIEAIKKELQSLRDRIESAAEYLRPIEPGNIHAEAVAILPASDIDHHGSDLYLKWSLASHKLVDRLTTKSLVESFTSQKDGARWYDLPFCYDPKLEVAQ